MHAASLLQHSFIRFLLVGVVNTLFGLVVIYMCRYGAGWSYWMSTFIGNSSGAAVSFLLNKSYTFRSANPYSSSALRFIAVVLACYFLAYDLGLRAAVSLMKLVGISMFGIENIAILSGMGLYAIFNYWGQRLFVFGEKKTH